MLSRRVAFVIFIIVSVSGYSQNQQLITSIKTKLASAAGQTRFELLNDLAWQYRVAYPDSCIIYGNEALDLGTKLKLKEGLARSMNFIGLGYNHRGDPLTAFEFYNDALTIATAQHDSLQIAHANNNIGRLFTEQGLTARSHEFFMKALSIFEKIHDSSGLAYTYQSLGTLNKILTSYDEAEENFLRAYALRLALRDTKDIMSAQTQIGKFYQDNRRYDKALYYFTKADSTGNVIHDAINLAEIKTLIADCYLHRDQLTQAEKMCKEGIDFIERSKNRRLLPGAYLTMGQIYFEKGDIASAKNYFIKALEVSTARKDLNSRMEAHYMLWKTYEHENNSKNSLLNFNQYIALKDSVASLEIELKQERLQFEIEINKKYQEVEKLRLEEAKKKVLIEKQHLENTILLIAIASVTTILFLLYRMWRRTQKSKDRIARVNALLNIKNTTLENHVKSLLSFSKNRNIITGHVADAARDLARAAAKNLQVSRVGVWIYSETSHHIEPTAAYSLTDDMFIEAEPLNMADYPVYFKSLKKEKVVVVNDVAKDDHTQEMFESYLRPLDIKSLLNTAFFIDGKLKGLICCEQQTTRRSWTPEDIIYIASIADIISLTYRTAQRREHDKQLIQHSKEIESLNERLEIRVKERTEELEIQNKQLAEYAFINSHLLRGPLSRILGLINLIEHDHSMKTEKLVELLRVSGKELDAVVQKITDTLQRRSNLSRDDFRMNDEK